MNRVFSYEFSDDARQKLMRRNLLPETGLSVDKIIQGQQSKNASNQISISNIKPLADIDKPLVPVRVLGVETMTQSGKTLSRHPFDLILKITIPSDPDLSPQVVDVNIQK